MPPDMHVILCRCSGFGAVSAGAVEQALVEASVAFEVVDDLCAFAALRDSNMRRWSEIENIHVIACFPRAVKCLFESAGVSLGQNAVIHNLRTDSPGKILEVLKDAPKGNVVELKCSAEKGWVPWFPVIDYSRCKNCGQCMNFCLFGVYSLSPRGRVEVTNPAGCKTSCPACARVCPETAIIFPKHPDPPINGAQVDDSNSNKSAAGVNLRQLLSGDVQSLLRKRTADTKPFAPGDIEQRKIMRLIKLQKHLGIPDDVIASVSSESSQKNSASSSEADK